MRLPGEWTWKDCPVHALPRLPKCAGERCEESSPWGFGCTRRKGHAGRHAASAGSDIGVVAVWHREPVRQAVLQEVTA